jgi:hypothetical protein
MTPNTARKIDPFAVEPNEEQEVSLVVQQAKAITVTNQDELAEGREFYVSAKALLQKIEDHHAPIIQAAHNTHKVAIAKKKELTGPLERAMKIVRNVCENFMLQDKKRQEEEQRKREEEVRIELNAKVESAKEKFAALADGAKDDAGKIAALKAALEDEQTTELEAQVIRGQLAVLETSAGNRAQVAAEAQAQLELDAMVAEPVPVVETSKVEGVSQSKTYIVEVTDLKALCAAIGRGEVPAAAVKEVASKLKSYAKDGIKLPGCKATEKVQARFSA